MLIVKRTKGELVKLIVTHVNDVNKESKLKCVLMQKENKMWNKKLERNDEKTQKDREKVE